VHHLAEGLGLEVVMGNQSDGQLGSMCTVAFGSAFQLTSRRAGELSDFLDMSDDLLTEPLQIQGGELAVRPGAGLGVEIDPDKLARYPQDACARHVPPNPEVPTTHHDKENTEMSIDQNASAAASGASATERFFADKQGDVADTPKERVDLLAREVLEAVHETIRKHEVTYDEYNALKAWLISVGQDGEWPLFLDVWVEHVVEEVANKSRSGSKGSIEGPYYVPDSPELGGLTPPCRCARVSRARRCCSRDRWPTSPVSTPSSCNDPASGRTSGGSWGSTPT
jgi:hypothetical protein